MFLLLGLALMAWIASSGIYGLIILSLFVRGGGGVDILLLKTPKQSRDLELG